MDNEMNTASTLNQDNRLVPITVRFTADAMDVIQQIAEANKMSKAELVRMAVDDRLIKYLESVVFIDEDQGEKVRKELYELGTVLSEIKLELNRIGVNINQQTRIKNMQYKYGGAVAKAGEKNNLAFSGEMNIIMKRFEDAVKRVCDALCHILG